MAPPADQLGTPRMIFDKSGELANTKRHDYLPFGEELYAGQGVRATTQGYTADSVRQKFTSQERDNETGLDYMHARYSASAQGRFTSADTFGGSTANPQSLNRYAYVNNNPMNFSDPTGHMPSIHMNPNPGQDDGEQGHGYAWDDPTSPDAVLQAAGGLPERHLREIYRWEHESAAHAIAEYNAGEAALEGGASADGSGGASTSTDVTFTKAELVTDDKNEKVLATTSFSASIYYDEATLNLDTDSGPNAFGGDMFMIRIWFLLPMEYNKGWGGNNPENAIFLGKDNMFRFPNQRELVNRDVYTFYPYGKGGYVDVRLKVRDKESENNTIRVKVGGSYKSGESYSGMANVHLIGNAEIPKRKRVP